MSENIQDDFNIFATSKRIKKEEPGPYKSPLETNAKWGIQPDQIVEKQVETPRPVTPEVQNSRPASYQQEVIAKPATVVTPQAQNAYEDIGNVGSELQKFRKYPAKTYDKLINKMVLFNEEEFYLIRDLSSEISIARKRSSMPNKGSLPRITENTVIRAALKAVFSKIGKTNTDLTTLQTEEALESYFNSLLK
ncbi:MAG: hypothetical protein PHY93_19500 [Bacteriovorax sp.]|nr:hypothetical protein [Bacteriovorax sp.]